MAVAVQTVAVPGAGTSVVVLSWKVATEALSVRTTPTSASPRLRTGRDADRSAAPQDPVHQGYPASRGISVGRPLWAGRRSSLIPGSESAVSYPRPYAVGRIGAADGRQSTVNFGHSRCIGPQVSGGLEGLARAAGWAEGPLQRRGHARVAAPHPRLAHETVVTTDGPHPLGKLGAVALGWEHRRARQSCHPRAISSGHERYSADSHGHSRRPLRWAPAP
jgi:hypothetical protein